MAKKLTDKPSTSGARGKLQQAAREAEFAAKVHLAGTTGKPVKDLNAGQVKRVAEPIFQAAAADMIAEGELGLPKRTARKTTPAKEDARRGPKARDAGAQKKAAKAAEKPAKPAAKKPAGKKPAAKPAAGGDVKAYLHTQKAALDALNETHAALSKPERAGVKAYFKAVHPRMSDPVVAKARDTDQRLTADERMSLSKIVVADHRKATAGKTTRPAKRDPRQETLDLRGGGARKGGHAAAEDNRRATAPQGDGRGGKA